MAATFQYPPFNGSRVSPASLPLPDGSWLFPASLPLPDGSWGGPSVLMPFCRFCGLTVPCGCAGLSRLSPAAFSRACSSFLAIKAALLLLRRGRPGSCFSCTDIPSFLFCSLSMHQYLSNSSSNLVIRLSPYTLIPCCSKSPAQTPSPGINLPVKVPS